MVSSDFSRDNNNRLPKSQLIWLHVGDNLMCKGGNTGKCVKQLISLLKPFLGAFEKLRKSDS
jgi:hypothetical protein